ncbi:polysaccharide pyruvyl transferase family protein [Brevibacterium casei]|uniref:polysaccharide pyruvyl transferase family protein n=1 Tax=Brevibacterium casei TaxID=33889 RepID=UPI00186B724D|nr:polysaccharide pyruvyl transferase family protein [Brevibacterium casei]MBE4694404.1 polysaccharide pyruvyl transferase family protein [Brevibacterium casei]MBY3577526.1 polysaccharide pyruvyl transferase family protein [Brevibacterium casei]MCT1447528.1 polysaccharide pyruvyl transferase family protein [Brevibacterium casei]MCT2357591.1 polysaccharide pyruvyl transferase family protein [Brevibacterium casei]MDH5148377.1 polysaccharide pyruvyl transferase family protein [Brevibacterium case
MTRVDAPARVQLLGYFGWGNFGDDLFRETCVDRASLMWPDSRVRVFEGRRANLSEPSPASRVRRLRTAVHGAVWSDAFAYCGGSVFSDLSGTAALRSRFFPRHSFEALGVSVGPFSSPVDGRDVVRALRGFDRVVVRDEESLQRLDGRAEFGGDLAALNRRFAPGRGRTGRTQEGRITICPSRAANVPAADLAEDVATALGAHDGEITVLALNSHPRLGDLDAANAVAARLHAKGAQVRVLDYGDIGIEGVIAVLRSSALVWTQRLHGAIAAYLLGVPFAIVDHHEKCGAFARDIGLSDGFLVSGFAELSPTLAVADHGPEQGRAAVWSRTPAEYRERALRTYTRADG